MKKISQKQLQALAQKRDYIGIILSREKHEHPVVQDKDGTLRWKADPVIDLLFKYSAVDLNKFFENGAQKNDPLVRLFYRQMGYSLFGYWEIFHWEVNNQDADLYKE